MPVPEPSVRDPQSVEHTARHVYKGGLAIESVGGKQFEIDETGALIALPGGITFGTHAARLAAAHLANQQWKESDTGLIYLDDGASWQILKGDGSVYKTSDQTVNNSNALVNDTDLHFPIEAAELWFAETILWVSAASTTADWLAGWTGPAGASAAWSNATGVNSAFVNQSVVNSPVAPKALGNSVAAGAISGDHFLGFSGWFQADATHAGNVQFQWAQNTPTAENNTVKKGSWLRLRRLA